MLDYLWRHRVVALSAFVLGIAAVAPASGQTPTGQPTVTVGDRGITMTPFMAMGDDLAPGGGVSFNFPMARRLTLEAEASVGMDAARSGLSLLVDVFRIGGFTTYVAGGAGIQRDEVHPELPGFPFDTRPVYTSRKKTEFALGIGAGTTVPVGPRWSYRADFRWYDPQAEWPESWRVYNGLTLRLSQ